MQCVHKVAACYPRLSAQWKLTDLGSVGTMSSKGKWI